MLRGPLRSAPRLLLLLLLPRPSIAGGSSSGAPWYHAEYENDFFESLLLIVFVFVALGFEIVWHGLGHAADHSYRYGKYHYLATSEFGMPVKDHRGNVQHPQLYKELYHRMGGEFMTLGILAFMIFALNQAGGFVRLAKALEPCVSDCFHHPLTDSDWLHLAEMVHVKLFVGMLLYYVLIFCLVRGSVHQIQQWEKLRMRFVNAENQTVAVPMRSLDRDLEKHMLWRDYFIEHILSWRRTRPDMFKQIMEKCRLDPVAPDSEAQLRHCFDERFSLSAYLSLNLENGVMDSIRVHKPTWAILLGFFGCFALAHHEAHLSLKTLVPVFIGVAFLIFIVIWYLKKEAQRKIKRFVLKCRSFNERDRFDPATFFSAAKEAKSAQKAKIQNIHERFNTEGVMLRAMQVFLFLIAYVFSETLLALEQWKANPDITSLTSLLFLSLFFVIARFLPTIVPIFVAVMAFPPYVDESNLAAFFAVLLDDHAPDHMTRQCSQGSDQLHLKLWDMTASTSSGSTTIGDRPACHGGVSLAVVRELADILGVGDQLEQRLRDRASGDHPQLAHKVGAAATYGNASEASGVLEAISTDRQWV